jgi:hypothetical protein
VPDSRLRRLSLLGIYCVLTWAFCGVFLSGRGLWGETVFYELSQTRSWWEGFIYPYQATRPLMTVPYQVAYLLSDGSYDSMNWLFMLMVLGTGLVTYRLARELMPASPIVAQVAGAIAIVHGADRMANFVPGMIVRQAVLAAASAALLFVIAYRRRSWPTFLAALLLHAVSLWTYEPGLLALAAVPLLLLMPFDRPDRARWLRWSAGWLTVPALYVAFWVKDYLAHRDEFYQAGRVVPQVSVFDIAWRELSIVAEGLAFWRWPLLWFDWQAKGCEVATTNVIAIPVVVGVVAMFLFMWWTQRNASDAGGPWAKRFAVAVLFALLCAVPYSIVNNTWLEGGPWRTQFFLAVPTAIALALIVAALARRSRLLAAGLATAILASGLISGLIGQLEQQIKWEEYRRVMAAIVERAPQLEQDSMVLLVGVPNPMFSSVCEGSPSFDPFSNDEIWFNSGLQVLYPGTRLLGLYLTEDGRMPGSIQFDFGAEGAGLRKATISIEGTAYRYEDMIAFAYDPRQGAVMLDEFPAREIPGASPDVYRPASRIRPGPPAAETLLKLGTGAR